MPREMTIASPQPVLALHCVLAAAAVDPDLGLAKLWNGGGVQIASDDGLVLAVLRSTALAETQDAERLLGETLPTGTAWLTEVYGPYEGDTTDAVARAVAEQVGGTVIGPVRTDPGRSGA